MTMTSGCPADKLVPGAILSYWHDTGAFGYQPIGVKVLKVTAAYVDLVDEWGHRARRLKSRALSFLDADIGADFRNHVIAKLAKAGY